MNEWIKVFSAELTRSDTKRARKATHGLKTFSHHVHAGQISDGPVLPTAHVGSSMRFSDAQYEDERHTGVQAVDFVSWAVCLGGGHSALLVRLA